MFRETKTTPLLKQLKTHSLEVSVAAQQMSSYSEKALDHTISADEDLATASDAIRDIHAHVDEVTSSATDFSAELNGIRAETQASTSSIEIVSDATRELAEASEMIAQNTEQARVRSKEAVNGVDTALEQVSGLEAAAHEIGNLTQVIHDISEQTKVLALNATIEAAREAAAGRGFAVVAREVKDLASETREATDFIRQKVSTIDDTIATTIDAIKTVSKVIGEVNDLVAQIAAAAEEQSVTTRSIASNSSETLTRFKAIYDQIYDGTLTMDTMVENLRRSSEKARSVHQAVEDIKGKSSVIAEECTVSFARSLEINERMEDILWEFEEAPIEVNAPPPAADPEMFRMQPRYSVFVDEMDREHAVIFDYINKVHRCFKNGSSQEELVKAFRGLQAYTIEHFADEEALMLKHKYPKYDEQKEAHTKLLASVEEFASTLEGGGSVNPAAALNMLMNWLKRHINNMDRDYGRYFKEKGIVVT